MPPHPDWSFSDPAKFRIVTSDSPVTVDGIPLGALTGQIQCLSCGEMAYDVDDISHTPDCDQLLVRSWFWQEENLAEGPLKMSRFADCDCQ